jgi:hypothetical protein
MHDDKLTVGWLLSQMIKRLKDDRILSLKTVNKARGFRLLAAEVRSALTPFKDGDELVTVYREEVPKYLHFQYVKGIGKGGQAKS